MLIDANLLLFAVDEASRFHQPSKEWITSHLNGPRRVGLPWQSLAAFHRISTHPRAFENPLSPDQAWEHVLEWLDADVSWIPQPGPHHGDLLGKLISRHQVRGNLLTDAQLAAIAQEHGLTVFSADTDFAAFTEVEWQNPLAP